MAKKAKTRKPLSTEREKPPVKKPDLNKRQAALRRRLVALDRKIDPIRAERHEIETELRQIFDARNKEISQAQDKVLAAARHTLPQDIQNTIAKGEAMADPAYWQRRVIPSEPEPISPPSPDEPPPWDSIGGYIALAGWVVLMGWLIYYLW